MIVKIKPEAEERLQEAIEILKKAGFQVSPRARIDIDTKEVYALGSMVPQHFIHVARGSIEFVIPDSLLE